MNRGAVELVSRVILHKDNRRTYKLFDAGTGDCSTFQPDELNTDATQYATVRAWFDAPPAQAVDGLGNPYTGGGTFFQVATIGSNYDLKQYWLFPNGDIEIDHHVYALFNGNKAWNIGNDYQCLPGKPASPLAVAYPGGSPAPSNAIAFSPNGDGVKDTIAIAVSLPGDWHVDALDSAGTTYTVTTGNGTATVTWAGTATNARGKTVCSRTGCTRCS